MFLLIFFFVLSIVFSFLCSIWEAVLLSVTPSYVKRKVQENSKTGLLLEIYKKDIDRPLSAILTLNTIAHTTGAIGVGAQAAVIYGSNPWDLGFMKLSPESLIAGGMTLAILILSEIIPKTLGANLWRSLAPFTVKSIRILMLILFPFVWLSQGITKRLKKDKLRSVFSRADFNAMAIAGQESGALDESEYAIIRNLLQFDELVVKDIMTPRAVIVMADEERTLSEFHESHTPLQFSRIPVYSGRSDNITGMVLKYDLLQNLVYDKHETTLKEIKLPVLAVEETLPLPKLFERLTRQRSHMAIVVDRYGSLVGLVSMEDLFETLLGLEIVDESDAVENLQSLARKNWEERAKKLGIIK